MFDRLYSLFYLCFTLLAFCSLRKNPHMKLLEPCSVSTFLLYKSIRQYFFSNTGIINLESDLVMCIRKWWSSNCFLSFKLKSLSIITYEKYQRLSSLEENLRTISLRKQLIECELNTINWS